MIQGQNAFQNPIRKDRTRIEEAARTLTGQIPYYKDRIQEAQGMPLEEALFHVPIGNFVNETKSKQDAFKQRQKETPSNGINSRKCTRKVQENPFRLTKMCKNIVKVNRHRSCGVFYVFSQS